MIQHQQSDVTDHVRQWNIAIGAFFFKYRNAIFPIFFVLAALIGRPRIVETRALNRLIGHGGIVVALLGQAVRLLTVGSASIDRGGKRGRVYANRLLQSGLYAVIRNPLYVSDVLIALGITMVAGAPFIDFIVLPLFLFIYQAIIAAEETYLQRKFGTRYARYCARVPRFLPSMRHLMPALTHLQWDWRRGLRKEMSTMTGLVIGLILFPVWRTYFLKGPAAARTHLLVALSWVGAVLALFAGLVYLKRHRRLFYAATRRPGVTQ